MTLTFPPSFTFGTSTSAGQIETAFGHDWEGIRARDGTVFGRTTDHELKVQNDIGIISSLAPNYRMSLMWSKLQREAYARFDPVAQAHYHQLLTGLRRANVSVMMVLHHFSNPLWFAGSGGWAFEKNIDSWCDYARKVVDEFGGYVSSWNTFNEPNLYATLGFMLGEFPPFRRNILMARRVIRNMGKAHDLLYDYIKEKYPDTSVGISHNCVVFSAENVLGKLTASFADMWYMDYMPRHFLKSDFFGMSYYARIGFDPMPLTMLYTPGKMKKSGKAHDDIWEYYPSGLYECMERYWKLFRKPIVITENGICTRDDSLRQQAIRDYMKELARAIENKIEVQAYYHWSTWDNFEWTLGPSFKFGLYGCDVQTMERVKRPSADLYSKLAHEHVIDVS